ncbi:NUDIX domain-containing protein [Agromyces sp. Leaf222]|uniref:NUDIX hydrolase n=1 Tax=Agromyces sp. Leaf222 TaxID=1735688 RepID=UPI000A6756FA|nr:NUDIX domain-containing protein [Agromyces sp. Leaf222]
MTKRDSQGRALADYPRPSVAVDTAVLTVPPGGPLSVIAVTGDGDLRLPGTFLHEGETLADAVTRSLAEKAGITGIHPVQLHVFDAPDRDDRGRVLSVAHLAPVRMSRLDAETRADPVRAQTELLPVAALPPMPFDHNAIVELAVAELRARYAERPDPFGLLPEPTFTIRELHELHEAVAGHPLPRDTFRRLMEPQLTPTGSLARGTVGKPAREFTRSAA